MTEPAFLVIAGLGTVEVAITHDPARLSTKWRGECRIGKSRIETRWLYSRSEVLDVLRERIAEALATGELTMVEAK